AWRQWIVLAEAPWGSRDNWRADWQQHVNRSFRLSGRRPGFAMALTVAVQMAPIERINIRGDSTFAMLLEGQKRGHRLSYYTPDRLAMVGGQVFATTQPLTVRDSA